ncbi:protein-disulfide reductase DsbD domain-containing protein [Rhodophyticola sp. CCM32]|uniref:protein-disulfide reductase DsbD domain-containing protein n=1 Tax=Rhodophyticola sp. CCM32 TaxID=2916397 RepID=UPI00143D2A38|nr:protein-disulfide reductase DsbD domain-containing protein [Rhodophyticola sp. CCM32]
MLKYVSLPACAAAILLALSAIAPVSAQFAGQSLDEVVQVRLLEGWRSEANHHMAAIHITMAPGWKTYWRAPGQGGIPPRLRLDPVEGVDGMSIHWPRPEVFFNNGMRSIGYHGDVILPLEFMVSENGTFLIEGQIDLGVCQDVCMPVTVDLEGVLSPGGRRDPLIAAALSDRPLSGAESGAGHATCAVTPISDGLRVEVRVRAPSVGENETVVFELPDPGIWISETTAERDGDIITAAADVVPADAGPFAMNRSDLKITVLGSHMAIELQGCHG